MFYENLLKFWPASNLEVDFSELKQLMLIQRTADWRDVL